MSGHGTLHMRDGTIYIGSFKANTFQGKGLLELADKTRYDGHFSDGQKNG